MYWCYSQPAELRFGHCCILASIGVQQGDLLGPLLFSLVLLQFLDSTSVCDSCLLNLWYLDDGTFIGSRSSFLALLSCLAQSGPNFACTSIYPNVNFFWPSGDCTFPNFSHAIKRINPANSVGVSGLGMSSFFESFLSTKLEKTASIQNKLAKLEDPQVELHLLRSCLSVCKVTHLLWCIPSSSLGCFPSLFDSNLNLRNCLSRIYVL